MYLCDNGVLLNRKVLCPEGSLEGVLSAYGKHKEGTDVNTLGAVAQEG